MPARTIGCGGKPLRLPVRKETCSLACNRAPGVVFLFLIGGVGMKKLIRAGLSFRV
jgi:hypothetical protein